MAILLMGLLDSQGLYRASFVELGLLNKRWIEKGCPAGDDLVLFMQGRGRDFAVSNRVFEIDGRSYLTQFALTKMKTGREGILFVTTNQEFILLEPNKTPQKVKMK